MHLLALLVCCRHTPENGLHIWKFIEVWCGCLTGIVLDWPALGCLYSSEQLYSLEFLSLCLADTMASMLRHWALLAAEDPLQKVDCRTGLKVCFLRTRKGKILL